MRSAFNRRRFAVALLVVGIAAGGSIGIAAAQSGGDSRATLADAVQATAKYHQLDVAKGDEYGLFVDKNNVACIAMDNMPEFEDARTVLDKAPSDYLSRFWYDSCTYTEETLRFLVDMVGIDQVVLGTDYPAPMILDDAVNWINGLKGFTPEEKDAILSRNPARLLGL